MMDGPTEAIVDKAIKYGTVFAEVRPPIWKYPTVDILQLNPIAKAVFGLASVTFEVRPHY